MGGYAVDGLVYRIVVNPIVVNAVVVDVLLVCLTHVVHNGVGPGHHCARDGADDRFGRVLDLHWVDDVAGSARSSRQHRRRSHQLEARRQGR